MSHKNRVRTLFLLLSMVSLQACGESGPPKCSDRELENSVAEFVLADIGALKNGINDRNLGTEIIDIGYIIDKTAADSAISIKFSDETTGQYVKDSNFRSCGANIKITVNKEKLEPNIKIISAVILKTGPFGGKIPRK